jgi:organic radical activating enzyme
VVVTGGEPALQLTPTLVDALHAADRYVAVETNGTLPLPENIDWITISPKDPWMGHEAHPTITRCNELKLVFDGIHDPNEQLSIFNFQFSTFLFLQPLDTGDPVRNAAIQKAAVEYIKEHPRWCLSLQIHKILSIQ